MRPSEAKLKVVWQSDKQEFIATHPNTNVKGYGRSPGESVRNWEFWWNIPY
jgi:hypothetical protein